MLSYSSFSPVELSPLSLSVAFTSKHQNVEDMMECDSQGHKGQGHKTLWLPRCSLLNHSFLEDTNCHVIRTHQCHVYRLHGKEMRPLANSQMKKKQRNSQVTTLTSRPSSSSPVLVLMEPSQRLVWGFFRFLWQVIITITSSKFLLHIWHSWALNVFCVYFTFLTVYFHIILY